ncbi:MAG: M15 family metallopeptidase [Burkholderiaceae bacterium]|nr:M15 family metallopeptidase [Burkholderiaceae bacterium]
MFLFVLFLYFVLAVVLVAGFLLPELRQRIFAYVGQGVNTVLAVLRRWSDACTQLVGALVRTFGYAGTSFERFVIEHRLLWGGTAGVLILSVLIGIVFGQRNVLFFDDQPRDIDPKVEALLKGEQLVPPPPLPPEVFATAEVEQVRPLTKEGSRDWDVLDADFRNRLLMVYRIMKEKYGYDLALLEGYRSPERQAKLLALGGNVTRAGANQSYHQYGLAADNAFYRDGKLVISEKDSWAMEGYRLYGETAESVGLVWGGRWSFKDYGHVEYHKPGFKRPPKN